MNNIRSKATKSQIACALIVLADFTNRYCRHQDDCTSRTPDGECNCGYNEHLRVVAGVFTPILTEYSDSTPIAVKRVLEGAKPA